MGLAKVWWMSCDGWLKRREAVRHCNQHQPGFTCYLTIGERLNCQSHSSMITSSLQLEREQERRIRQSFELRSWPIHILYRWKYDNYIFFSTSLSTRFPPVRPFLPLISAETGFHDWGWWLVGLNYWSPSCHLPRKIKVQWGKSLLSNFE